MGVMSRYFQVGLGLGEGLGYILVYQVYIYRSQLFSISSTQGLTHSFIQGQALYEIRADVIHSKCINKTNFMSDIDTYTHH